MTLCFCHLSVMTVSQKTTPLSSPEYIPIRLFMKFCQEMVNIVDISQVTKTIPEFHPRRRRRPRALLSGVVLAQSSNAPEPIPRVMCKRDILLCLRQPSEPLEGNRPRHSNKDMMLMLSACVCSLRFRLGPFKGDEERHAHLGLQTGASSRLNASFFCLTAQHYHPCNQDRSGIMMIWKGAKQECIFRDSPRIRHLS